MQFSEIRNYGINIVLKDYAKFPRILPLPCQTQHGWEPSKNILKRDLKTDKPLMMVFSKRQAEAWQKVSQIPVAVMGSPYIHYKNLNKISKKKSASGTIVFPCHSTYEVKSKFQIKNYCRMLKNLPKQFQPVTICLFWLDYIDKKSDIYRRTGFNVVSAGPRFTNSLDFMKRFYDILSGHKYASSNEVGSYAFCAVDLGIPFFLYGQRPVLINEGNKDKNIDRISKVESYYWGKKATKLFSTGPVQEINIKQAKFVAQEMGVNDCLSPWEMKLLLWKYYNKNHYWIRAFIPYIFYSFFYAIIFNGPWIKILISVRKKIA